jgi:hypothetical protein
MKKQLLTLLAAISFCTASAQINKDAVMISAQSNLNFTSAESDGESNESFILKAALGYFVAENLAIGPVFGYEKEGDLSTTSIGIFGRYYVNGKVFFGAGYTSNRIKVDLGSFGGDITVKYNAIPLEIGYAAFITPNVAVEPSIGYTIVSGDADGSAFGFNVGFGIYLNRE